MNPYQYVITDGTFILEQGFQMAKDAEAIETWLREQLKGEDLAYYVCFATGRNGIVRLKLELPNG